MNLLPQTKRLGNPADPNFQDLPSLKFVFYSFPFCLLAAGSHFNMKYSKVEDEDSTSGDSDGYSETKHFLEGSLDGLKPFLSRRSLWMVSTFALLFILGLLVSFEIWLHVISKRDSYEAGFRTELGQYYFLKIKAG